MTLMVDPPSGWKYGFPKAKPDDATDTIAWLLSEGYPQSEIDKLGSSFCAVKERPKTRLWVNIES